MPVTCANLLRTALRRAPGTFSEELLFESSERARLPSENDRCMLALDALSHAPTARNSSVSHITTFTFNLLVLATTPGTNKLLPPVDSLRAWVRAWEHAWVHA